MFNGVTGDFIKTELRAGNVYTSRQVVKFVGPVFKRYNKKFKTIPFHLKADSGFATPGLYRISEVHEINYVIRLKANSKLYKLAKPLKDELVQKCKVNMHKHQSIFDEFGYKAGSWDKKRRVFQIQHLTILYHSICENKSLNEKRVFPFL